MNLKNVSNETIFVVASFAAISSIVVVFNATKNHNNTLALAAGFAAATTGYLAYHKSKQIKSTAND